MSKINNITGGKLWSPRAEQKKQDPFWKPFLQLSGTALGSMLAVIAVVSYVDYIG